MLSTPKVSVVMGVYNGEKNLRETIDSVLSQSLSDIEFIIVNDGSTDTTASILNEYAESEPRIRIVTQENLGLTAALIKACSAAKGKYIARQDVGDISLPNRLELQTEMLEQNDEMVFATCRFETVGPDGDILLGPQQSYRQDRLMRSLKLEGGQMIGPLHGTIMMKYKFYLKAGGYRKEFYFAQDLDLWSRLVEMGDLGCVEEVLCRIQFSPDGITGRYHHEQQKLNDLITKCTRIRRAGGDESQTLKRASQVKPSGDSQPRRNRWAAEYFIASCLHAQKKPKARKQLWMLLKKRPANLKVWFKLGSSLFHKP